MALENVFYFNFKVLSRLPNRNKVKKLLRFAVFDFFLSSQIVCCSYVRYIYILNQITNYYTLSYFLMWNCLWVQHCIFEKSTEWFSWTDRARFSVRISKFLHLAFPQGKKIKFLINYTGHWLTINIKQMCSCCWCRMSSQSVDINIYALFL